VNIHPRTVTMFLTNLRENSELKYRFDSLSLQTANEGDNFICFYSKVPKRDSYLFQPFLLSFILKHSNMRKYFLRGPTDISVFNCMLHTCKYILLYILDLMFSFFICALHTCIWGYIYIVYIYIYIHIYICIENNLK
jgi:hypothetical protein